MEQEARKCPSCGESKLHRGDVNLTRTVAGCEISATVPALVCRGCGESLVDLEDGERFDLAIAELLSEAAPTGEGFRFLRKAAGLRAKDLAELLGVTGDTISRWENDKYAIDRAAFLVLGQIVRERRMGSTAMVDRIRRIGEQRAPPPRVRLELE